MRPHPRIRKTIKWVWGGGAVVTVLLVVVWIGSGWLQWTSPFPSRGVLGMHYGGWWIRTGWGSPSGIEVLGYGDGRFHFRLWPLHWYRDRVRKELWVPGWMPIVPSLACAALAWHLDTIARRREHRAKLNLCPKCNYDRTGLASKDAKCPECGSGGATGG